MPTLQDTARDFLRQKAQQEQPFSSGSIFQNAQNFLKQKTAAVEKPTFMEKTKNFFSKLAEEVKQFPKPESPLGHLIKGTPQEQPIGLFSREPLSS